MTNQKHQPHMTTEDLTSEGFTRLRQRLLESKTSLDILASSGIERQTIQQLPIWLWESGNLIYPIYKWTQVLGYIEVLISNLNVMVLHGLPNPVGSVGYIWGNKEQPLIVASTVLEYMLLFQSGYDNVIVYVSWLRPWILDIRDYSIYWLHTDISDEILHWPKGMKSLGKVDRYKGWLLELDVFEFMGKNLLREVFQMNPFIHNDKLHYLLKRWYTITCLNETEVVGKKYYESPKWHWSKVYFDNWTEWTVHSRPLPTWIDESEEPWDTDYLFKELFDYLWHSMNFISRDQCITLATYVMYLYIHPWSRFNQCLQIFTKLGWQKRILRDVLRKVVPSENYAYGSSTFILVENNGNTVASYYPHILIDSLSYDKNHYANWIPLVISPEIYGETEREIDMRPMDYLRDRLFAWAMAYKPKRKNTYNHMYSPFELTGAKRSQLEAVRRTILISKQVLWKCRHSNYSWWFRVNATNWAKAKSKLSKKDIAAIEEDFDND